MATDAERNRGLGAYTTPGIDDKPEQGPSKIITSSPLVTYRFKDLEPPTFAYITRDDQLRLTVTYARSSATVNFRARILRTDGVVVTNEWDISPIVNPSTVTITVPIPEGFLLSIVAVSQTSPLQRGGAFAKASLVRPGSGSGPFQQHLFADYVGTNSGACFPNGRVIHSLEGPGSLFSLPFGPFGVGTEILVTCPTNSHWRLISILATLVTSATVATRNPQFIIDDGTNAEFQFGPSVGQAASLTVQHTITPGNTLAVDAAGNKSVALPDWPVMLATWRFRTLTQGLQAGDQWTVANVGIEEWCDAQ